MGHDDLLSEDLFTSELHDDFLDDDAPVVTDPLEKEEDDEDENTDLDDDDPDFIGGYDPDDWN